MVTSVTSLTGNGLKDWLIQRVTAVYLLVYVVWFGIRVYFGAMLSYGAWSQMFADPVVKVATIMAVFSLFLHAWIGIWTVTTDYIKCTLVRFSVQMLVLFILLAQLIFGIMILWGR